MPKTTTPKNDFDYALTESIAKPRFDAWQSIDPFPKISPALLNSADIADYVLATSMIWPFHIGQLKSAAYEMQLGNEFLYWDDKGKEIHSTIDDSNTLILKKNSITYVTLKETFYLPDYIALRFNLVINHVHRGLLLGTGPLVNPGFQGKLMVPIHNLTPNEYPLRPGDPLISVEFTKLSPIADWTVNKSSITRPVPKGQYVTKHKKGLVFKEYLQKALPHGVDKVESSLSHALDAANNEIREFREEASAEIKKASISRNIVTGGALIGLAGLVIMTYQIFQSNQEFFSQAVDKKNEEILLLRVQKNNLERLDQDLQKIKSNGTVYAKDKVLQSRIKALETEINQISTKVDSALGNLRVVK